MTMAMSSSNPTDGRGPGSVVRGSHAWLRRRVAPTETALILVDFQNDFCADGGFYDRNGFDVTMGQQAAASAGSLLPTARRAGVTVILVGCAHGADYMSPVAIELHHDSSQPLDCALAGTWGSEFYGVEPEEGDVVVYKRRYSPFVYTELEAVLHARSIKNLVIGGVSTNVCVDSTVRDGYMRDYRITVLEDCCGSYARPLHDASLETIRRAFGAVVTSDEVMEIWKSAAGD